MSKLLYPEFDEKQRVVCQICGKGFLVISPTHLKRKHNISYEEYTRRFPDAPLASKDFIARGKFGKHKELFLKDEITVEELVDEFEPEIEEMNIEKLIKEYKNLSPMELMKHRIIDHLKIYFSNIRKDYLITQYGTDNRLKFEFITDFCDPVLRIVIQFPETFWHNKDAAFDANKNLKLSQYGWKVIEIPTTNPSLELITSCIEEF
jgi:hypothetical protein